MTCSSNNGIRMVRDPVKAKFSQAPTIAQQPRVPILRRRRINPCRRRKIQLQRRRRIIIHHQLPTHHRQRRRSIITNTTPPRWKKLLLLRRRRSQALHPPPLRRLHHCIGGRTGETLDQVTKVDRVHLVDSRRVRWQGGRV
ncbi:hypothetical protein LINGRAHAP2_LOCUS9076 [Linum grandiflorum]